MNIDIIFHYPPELLSLLIDTIPLLCRTKKVVLLFFKGAAVGNVIFNDLEMQLNKNRESIKKCEITRIVLTRLNEKGEATLRERREIIKRVTEFEDFSTCWPGDQLKTKGLVSEIRRVVNVKDSFTRMRLEREKEREKHQEEQEAELKKIQEQKGKLATIKKELFALFTLPDAQRRGKALEGVLNRIFKASSILVREAFTLKGTQGDGIIEQIDGVVEIDGEIYLVEMKWWNEPLGVPEVSQHLVRIYHRGYIRGIFISSSGYTAPAINTCKEALQKTVVVLCKLEEIVKLLEQEGSLKDLLKAKIKAAIVDKNPMYDN